jgi:multidrug efflux pump subunit AcrA (membrane-fusion protein)
LEAIISVQEEDYPLISPGQAVELFFEANPELEITGTVDRIVPRRISTERALYSVYLSLAEVPGTLVEGMTVDSSIILDSRTDAVRLPRAIAHVNSDGTAIVKIWQNGHTVERQIQVGLRGDVYVEVLDGLQAGDLVVNQ